MPFITRSAIFLLAFLGVALFAGGPAAAQTISGKAKEAETFAAQGKSTEAMAAIDDAVGLLWAKVPLSCRRILWVSKEAPGYGQYDPLASNVFHSGEPMLSYAEPIGVVWRKSGAVWNMDVVTDAIIRSKNGAELRRVNNFGRMSAASRARSWAIYLNGTYTLTGIPGGEYLIETVLHDKVSGKQGSCTLPFAIR